MTEPIAPSRLNKRMAELGLCSRREADDWIAEGWVKVNGRVAEMGVKVFPPRSIEVDRRRASTQQQHGDDPAAQADRLRQRPGRGRPRARDRAGQPANHWREDPSRERFTRRHARGLAPAGRLDIDSVGLLVLTQDGRVARQLIGEDSDIEKEYLVRVSYGPVAQNSQAAFPRELLARLRHGLSLDGQPLKPAKVDWQNPEQLRFVLTEGKKRQIRRMCEQVGLKVVGLKRIRIGKVVLGNLPVGAWRYLGADERF